MIPLHELLLTHDGEREFCRIMAGNIRAENFAATREYILQAMAHYGTHFLPICRAINPDLVQTTGWDDIDRIIVMQSGTDTPCRALGIDLTGHHDGDEPGFEISYYGQAEFTTLGRAALLAECEDYGTWWQGSFMNDSYSLSITALAMLHGAIKQSDLSNWRYENRDATTAAPEFIGYHLAQWYLYAVVHEVIGRDIAARGLAAAMPVIISEHDFGPWIASVIMSNKISDHGFSATQIQAESHAQREEFRAEVTEKNIKEWTEQRKQIRQWKRFFRTDAQKHYIRLCEAQFNLFLSVNDMPPTRPPWDMRDDDFIDFFTQYRLQRAAKYAA